MSKCFSTFNGYEVKDAQARQSIENIMADAVGYSALRIGSQELTEMVEATPSGKVLNLNGDAVYELSETLDLSEITIIGNGATIEVKRADEGFTFNNTHKHVVRVFDNVVLRGIRFVFGYTATNEQFPNNNDIHQRGMGILGSNVSISECYFEYTQTNTILVYGENVHNVKVSDCILKNCASGIQCETAADLTGADYSVTFENCYVHAFSSSSGIGTASFIGCTFEHRMGGSYPNFQVGINDADVEIGSVTSCINCTFISEGNYVNVIVYGFNTVANHTHRGVGSFVGCTFKGNRIYGIKVCGQASFDSCIFNTSITPASVDNMPIKTVHITIINSVFLGVNGLSDILYLVSNTTATPCNITMIGCHVNQYEGNNLRLLNVPVNAGDVTKVVMINNITNNCGVGELKTPAVWFNNYTHEGVTACGASEVTRIKYRWLTDLPLLTAVKSSYLTDAEFISNAYGVYFFDDQHVRFIGLGKVVDLGVYTTN